LRSLRAEAVGKTLSINHLIWMSLEQIFIERKSIDALTGLKSVFALAASSS